MPHRRPPLLVAFTAFAAVTALAALALPCPAHAMPDTPAAAAEAPDSTMLERRVAQVAAMLSGTATDPGELFAPSFLAAVPAERVRALSQQLLQQLGPVTTTSVTERTGELAGKWRFHHARGFATPVTISIEPAAPHRIVGLFLATPSRLAASFDELAAELRALPGQVSWLVARLDERRIVPLAQHEPDRVLAIGSAFKLWILAELVRQVEAGERRWEDVVRLDPARRSRPSGTLQTWPAGTPVTVQTLATLMISQSDNTATDELLHFLGREPVEAAVRATGHATPERNVPFLSTREMFALKAPANRGLKERFLAGDAPARRAVLAEVGRQAEVPVPDLATPNAIDRLEWFASANDLARALLWLRDHTTGARTAPARELLSVNPGLGLDRTRWPYIGFKGGSETGVVNLTWLLRDSRGRWVVCIASWNDPTKDVELSRFASLVQRSIELAGAP